MDEIYELMADYLQEPTGKEKTKQKEQYVTSLKKQGLLPKGVIKEYVGKVLTYYPPVLVWRVNYYSETVRDNGMGTSG